MIIKVSAQDIENGNRSKDACPITLALRKKFGNKVVVARSFIRQTKKSGEVILVPLPKKAQDYYLDTLRSAMVKDGFKFTLWATVVKRLRGR